MAPQRLEKIGFATGTDMAPDASNLQHLVLGRGGVLSERLGASARKLQILAPNALKSLPRLQILPPSAGEATKRP
jgi:hypothetical protein